MADDDVPPTSGVDPEEARQMLESLYGPEANDAGAHSNLLSRGLRAAAEHMPRLPEPEKAPTTAAEAAKSFGTHAVNTVPGMLSGWLNSTANWLDWRPHVRDILVPPSLPIRPGLMADEPGVAMPKIPEGALRNAKNPMPFDEPGGYAMDKLPGHADYWAEYNGRRPGDPNKVPLPGMERGYGRQLPDTFAGGSGSNARPLKEWEGYYGPQGTVPPVLRDMASPDLISNRAFFEKQLRAAQEADLIGTVRGGRPNWTSRTRSLMWSLQRINDEIARRRGGFDVIKSDQAEGSWLGNFLGNMRDKLRGADPTYDELKRSYDLNNPAHMMAQNFLEYAGGDKAAALARLNELAADPRHAADFEHYGPGTVQQIREIIDPAQAPKPSRPSMDDVVARAEATSAARRGDTTLTADQGKGGRAGLFFNDLAKTEQKSTDVGERAGRLERGKGDLYALDPAQGTANEMEFNSPSSVSSPENQFARRQEELRPQIDKIMRQMKYAEKKGNPDVLNRLQDRYESLMDAYSAAGDLTKSPLEDPFVKGLLDYHRAEPPVSGYEKTPMGSWKVKPSKLNEDNQRSQPILRPTSRPGAPQQNEKREDILEENYGRKDKG